MRIFLCPDCRSLCLRACWPCCTCYVCTGVCFTGACCVCALTPASRARVCQQGVALSVHLSSLERSHSVTPVAVRALCPPQCVALLPYLPLSSPPPSPFSSPNPPPHSCLLSCVHWPSSHSSEHVLFISQSPAHTSRLTHKMHANTVCIPIHSNGHTLKMKSHKHSLHEINMYTHRPLH